MYVLQFPVTQSEPSKAITIMAPQNGLKHCKPRLDGACHGPLKSQFHLWDKSIGLAEGSPCEYSMDTEHVLGKGKFGIVYKGHVNAREEEKVAIKVPIIPHLEKESRPEVIQKQYEARLRPDTNEVDILQYLSSPHIVTLLGWYTVSDEGIRKVYMVFPCEDGGDLNQYILKQGYGGLSDKETQIVCKCLLLALAHMQTRKVVRIGASADETAHPYSNQAHRDIKPDNIMVIKNPDGALVNAKLTDMGTAKCFSDEKLRSNYGTPFLNPPKFFQMEARTPRNATISVLERLCLLPPKDIGPMKLLTIGGRNRMSRRNRGLFIGSAQK